MIVDASAIVAIMLGESDAEQMIDRLDSAPRTETHAISVYEASAAVARRKGLPFGEAEQDVANFLREAGISIMPIGAGEASGAVRAAARYGRGRHPAKLNMGDCFSYACAKVRGVPLLYKGEDFAQTDLAWV